MAFGAGFAAAAFYYATLDPAWLRSVLAACFTVLAIAALVLRPLRVASILWGGVMLAFLTWYAGDAPRNDRDWEPEYAVPATVEQHGRRVQVRNVRNFSYRSETDLTPAYYDASFDLDDLTSVDLVSSYWSGEAIAHVFLTFGFRDGRHLAFSIETRRAKGVGYSTAAGFFHHYELFYVVADERDLIGVRTDIRREHVYLYRLKLSPEIREALFLSYLDKVRQLATRPEWYNTVTANCTTGILGRAETVGSISYDWRVLLSGFAAEYAYSLGLLANGDRSFQELQRESLVERPSDASPSTSYSDDIRRGLPSEPENGRVGDGRTPAGIE